MMGQCKNCSWSSKMAGVANVSFEVTLTPIAFQKTSGGWLKSKGRSLLPQKERKTVHKLHYLSFETLGFKFVKLSWRQQITDKANVFITEYMPIWLQYIFSD